MHIANFSPVAVSEICSLTMLVCSMFWLSGSVCELLRETATGDIVVFLLIFMLVYTAHTKLLWN